MTKRQEDLKLGLDAEKSIKPILESVFGELKPKRNTNDPFDFDGDNKVIELKTRRIKHNQYDTLFFGKNKYDKGCQYLEEGVRVYYVFNCLDGIYYWEQNENECFHKRGGRFDRGRPEVQMLTNVPTKYLKKIECEN